MFLIMRGYITEYNTYRFPSISKHMHPPFLTMNILIIYYTIKQKNFHLFFWRSVSSVRWHFSVSVIHEEKFASRALYVPLRSAHNRGLPDLLRLSLTNAQKYRHAKYACLILACLYALVPNLFFVNYWNLEKMNNEYLTTNPLF